MMNLAEAKESMLALKNKLTMKAGNNNIVPVLHCKNKKNQAKALGSFHFYKQQAAFPPVVWVAFPGRKTIPH